MARPLDPILGAFGQLLWKDIKLLFYFRVFCVFFFWTHFLHIYWIFFYLASLCAFFSGCKLTHPKCWFYQILNVVAPNPKCWFYQSQNVSSSASDNLISLSYSILAFSMNLFRLYFMRYEMLDDMYFLL